MFEESCTKGCGLCTKRSEEREWGPPRVMQEALIMMRRAHWPAKISFIILSASSVPVCSGRMMRLG